MLAVQKYHALRNIKGGSTLGVIVSCFNEIILHDRTDLLSFVKMKMNFVKFPLDNFKLQRYNVFS